MTRIAIAALAAVLPTAASANGLNIRFYDDNAYISYADLDLHTATGQAQMTGRIRTAASRLCTSLETSLQPLATSQQCYRIAVASGVEQMTAIAGSKPRG